MAEITKVEFLDKDGEVKNVFEAGDDITARIFYKTKKIITKPVFGVAVYTQDGIAISGPNTRTSKFEISPIEGDGYIDFCILNNPFFPGKYHFTSGIYEWNCIVPFDIKAKAHNFTIFSSEEKQYGLVKMNHQWKE